MPIMHATSATVIMNALSFGVGAVGFVLVGGFIILHPLRALDLRERAVLEVPAKVVAVREQHFAEFHRKRRESPILTVERREHLRLALHQAIAPVAGGGVPDDARRQ